MKKQKATEIHVEIKVVPLQDGRFKATATALDLAMSETAQTSQKAALKAVDSLMVSVDKAILWDKSAAL